MVQVNLMYLVVIGIEKLPFAVTAFTDDNAVKLYPKIATKLIPSFEPNKVPT